MTPEALRTWIMRSPKPVAIRAVHADGHVDELAVSTADSWRELVKTLLALDCVSLQCIGADGSILRAFRFDEDQDDEPPAPAPASGGYQDLPLATLTKLVETFADRIAKAYEHSTHVAFDHLVRIVEAQNKRTEGLERIVAVQNKALQQAYQEQADTIVQQAAANGQEPTEFLGSLIQTFMRSAMTASAEKPQSGKASE